MNVIRNPENGTNFIDYEVTANVISFAGGELAVNLAAKERDNRVILDVCEDNTGGLVLTPAGSRLYMAQIEIPARQYVETAVEIDGESAIGSEPVAFNIDNVTLTLYEREV